MSIRAVAEGILIPEKSDYRLLGSPLNIESVPGAMAEKSEQLKRLAARLPILPAHQALFLLKNCLGIPKVTYMLRTSLTWKQPECLREFDGIMRAALQTITNVEMTDSVWDRATQLVRYGGLGMRTTEQICLPAYLASVYSSMTVISELRTDAVVENLTSEAAGCWQQTHSLDLPEMCKRTFQREWDRPVCEKIFRQQLQSGSLEEQAHLLSVSAKNAGAWVQALPSSTLGNLFDNDTLRITVALRLRAPIYREHRCTCRAPADAFGHHGLRCKFSAGRQSRHNAINDLICRSAISAGVPAEREPVGLCASDDKRPDGLTMGAWSKGRCMAWDVTVVCPLALSYVAEAAETAGKAAEMAELEKRDKYAELENHYIFCPVGIETFGAYGPGAEKLITELGRRLAEKSGQPRSGEFLRQRISIEVQRGNAVSVKGTLPRSADLHEIYHVLNKK